MRLLRCLMLVLVLVLAMPRPAAAQDGDVAGDVSIEFDVGDIDPDTGEWMIDAVLVSGDLEEGAEFTVVLTDADGAEVWSSTQEFTAPVTEIEVTEPLAVGDVASAGVEQAQTIVGGVQIEAPEVEWSAGGGAGGGQLALSMVLAVLLVAIVFRTPLPSATTQRWTR